MTALQDPHDLPVVKPIQSENACCASCRQWLPEYAPDREDAQRHGFCLNKTPLSQRRREGWIEVSIEKAGVMSKRESWCSLYRRGSSADLPDSMFGR